MNNNWFCLLIHRFDCICFTIKSSVNFIASLSLRILLLETKFLNFCVYMLGKDTQVLLCILLTISELCTTSTFCRLSSVILLAFTSAGLDMLNIVHKAKTWESLLRPLDFFWLISASFKVFTLSIMYNIK